MKTQSYRKHGCFWWVRCDWSKRSTHTWKSRFAFLIGWIKARTMFSLRLTQTESLSMYEIKRKFPCPGQESNSRPSDSVVGTSDKHVVFGGWWVQFSPGVRKFSLSRASMISPPSKLKMFTGSVCVLLTSVSLKVIKIKIKLIYATTSSWEKTKMAGES